ncbi:MAG: energy-coupling factor transporter transmembrane protein EcfT [Lachnospiraceae bacterium]|nr:energy-coupling factor transporter transmembrane protein EcfT [Lachnospiraceae bacterium]
MAKRSRVLNYEKKNTVIHELSGFTKLIFFLTWSLASMLTYDTIVLFVMLILGFVIFAASKTRWDQVGTVFWFILLFLCINVTAIFFFSPYEGCGIYNQKTVICHLFGRYDLTREQLFYEMNIILKYFTFIPAVFIFLVTTDPSELAASLNRAGLNYNICYSFALALRYIPDVQNDFRKIKNASQARGIEMSKKAGLFKRIRETSSIIFPLVFSSMDRIDTISNAMELRGFGKHKKRTWYSARPLLRNDYIAIAFFVLFFAASMIYTYHDGSRFCNAVFDPYFMSTTL